MNTQEAATDQVVDYSLITTWDHERNLTIFDEYSEWRSRYMYSRPSHKYGVFSRHGWVVVGKKEAWLVTGDWVCLHLE